MFNCKKKKPTAASLQTEINEILEVFIQAEENLGGILEDQDILKAELDEEKQRIQLEIDKVDEQRTQTEKIRNKLKAFLS